MKRYTFYLLVALLIFGIGSYFALKLLWTSNLETSASPQFLKNISKKTDFKSTFPKQFDLTQKSEERQNKPFCNDQNILPVWKVLLKDKTFNDYIRGLNETIDCNKVLDIKKINLNNDSKKELIVSGKTYILCGGTGNCGFWIFEINNERMQKLLSNTNYLDYIEKEDSLISIQKNKTKGYSDILLKGHITGYETSFRKYKFNGRKYIETKCSVEAFHMNGEREVLTCKEWQKRSNENSKALEKDETAWVKSEEKPTKPFCYDKNILPIWKVLLRDKGFREQSPFSVDGKLGCEDLLEIKRIDLNHDENKEILVRAINGNLCSAVGNCRFWIFEIRGRNYRKLLDEGDYIDVSKLGEQILKKRTRGYYDVLLKWHFGALDTGYQFYKFDGKKYKLSRDLVNAYSGDSDGKPTWEMISAKRFWNRNR